MDIKGLGVKDGSAGMHTYCVAARSFNLPHCPIKRRIVWNR